MKNNLKNPAFGRSRLDGPSALLVALAFILMLAVSAGAVDPFFTARSLISSQGCRACHFIATEGGDYALSLNGIAARKSPEEIRDLLMNGVNTRNDARYMPPHSHLRDEEIEALVNYLENFK